MTIERTADLGTTYADRVLREAQAAATGGLGPEQAQRVAANILEGLEKQSEALKQAEYAPGDYERIDPEASNGHSCGCSSGSPPQEV